jgi:putative toxin-antitoxin system antitoxin component (TIGR02293 family)
MRPSEALNLHRDEIRRIVESRRATNPRVFGSVLRGEDTEESDLDLLVDPTPKTSLLDVVNIISQLQNLLGIPVDVGTPNGLHPRIRDRVIAEARPISDWIPMPPAAELPARPTAGKTLAPISPLAETSRAGAHMTQAAKRPGLLTSLRLDLESVEAGVPVETITSFVLASGVELKEINAVVISARALGYRRSRKQALSLDESDRLARFVRIFDQAVSVFGDAEKARRWLSKPKERFHERTPLQMLRTDFGGRAVEEMLGQLDHGMFA